MTAHDTDKVDFADDVCALPLVRRVAALLDRDAAKYGPGDILPRGWHFILFPELAPRSLLPRDGYPLAPGGGDPARTKVMLGGRRARYFRDIAIGHRLRRERRIVRVTEKTAASGTISILLRESRITDVASGEACIVEEEDMIIRRIAAGAGGSHGGAEAVPAPSRTFAESYTPGEADLFRFSALSNNAHRIHYDHPYATGAEGYPALVVNGGLTGLVLLEAARARMAATPESTALRWSRPVFLGDTIGIEVAPAGAGWRASAYDPQGRLAAELVAK